MKRTWKEYLLYGSVISGGGILLFILIQTIRAKNTGFETKTLWDWMELLIIPLVLAIGAFYLQRSERAVERELATDQQQEAALQAYLDHMADLLLKDKVVDSENEKVLDVARVRTLTVMRRLNAARNRIVLRFLHEIGLIGKKESELFVSAYLDDFTLQGAKLSETNLENTNLENANLEGAILNGANLEHANLENASLQGANLHGANLHGAKLQGANLQGAFLVNAILDGAWLSHANLERANLEHANLENASLQGANLQGSLLGYTNLQGVILDGANLHGANLYSANLHGASLDGAVFKDAYLRCAIISEDQLAIAKTLRRAVMPDGTKHV